MSDPMMRLNDALQGRYRIEHELGQGGMAFVYLAEDLKHRREVALKVLRPDLAQAVGAERFLLEIETTAGLRHPHILPLYDSGEADGYLYYVMPVVDGESLRDRLDREQQLPLDDALTITRQVADALEFAHSRGLVHRDVKPANIMLEAGHAVLTDFGIARAVRSAESVALTSTGVSLGTPLYMSPEQATGDDGLDRRSDLYSLGCVLYEMLAGRPPFTGDNAGTVVRQHVVAEPPSITALRSTVPESVAQALARALAKQPADRFETAALFSQALSSEAASVAGTPAPARPLRRLALAGVAIVAVAAAWFGGGALRGAAGTTGTIERIAVLPMDNQTGDAAQTFFASGMTRELIGVLTEVDIRVLGYRAVSAYAQSTKSATEIAQELDVDALVTGAIMQAGDVIQIAAELTDPATNENLWSRTFSRAAPDVVTLQNEIALEIARGIRARLSPEQEQSLGEAPPVDPRAYAEYLLGKEQLNLRSPETIRRSIEYLEASVVRDASFGPAWATLAMANAMGFFYGAVPADSARAATAEATERALALDPTLGDAFIARGLTRFLLDWDFAGADRDMRSGMAGNPTPMAQAFYTYFPWGTNQHQEATRAVLRILEVEPTTAQWRGDAAWIRWAAGDSAEARTYAEQAIRYDSTFPEPHVVLGFLAADRGDIPAAERARERAEELAPDYPLNLVLEGYVLARAGDTEGARRVLDSLSRGGQLADQALVHAALGEYDDMYDRFERAIDAREPNALWYLNAHPALRPLRAEPRYQELLDRMGLPGALRR